MCIVTVFGKNNQAGGDSVKKRNLNQYLLEAVEKIARIEVKKTIYGWPPDCAGIFHQPKRPKKKQQ